MLCGGYPEAVQPLIGIYSSPGKDNGSLNKVSTRRAKDIKEDLVANL